MVVAACYIQSYTLIPNPSVSELKSLNSPLQHNCHLIAFCCFPRESIMHCFYKLERIMPVRHHSYFPKSSRLILRWINSCTQMVGMLHPHQLTRLQLLRAHELIYKHGHKTDFKARWVRKYKADALFGIQPMCFL